MKKLLALAFAVGFATHALAAKYTFTTTEEYAVVELTIQTPSKAFRMPAWAPGDYQLFNYGKRIFEPVFTKDGSEVKAEKGDDPNLWTIPEGANKVVYKVRPSRGNFSPNLVISNTYTFISGPGVFGWFDGHQNEPQELTLPEKAYSPLGNSNKLIAKDYDELLDSPIVYGPSVKSSEKKFRDKPHFVVAFNNSENFNFDGYMDVSLKAVEECYKLFGELPYSRYYFMFDVGGPGGGLEHRDSARMGIWKGGDGMGDASLIFHEYMHAFNVKRIRAEVLGPFDYTKPARTSSLWWLEGVTDYYADILAARAGVITSKAALREINNAVRQCETDRYKQTPASEASLKVWDTERSYGFNNVSYYVKGKAIGFLLDLAIRGETKGKKSLDDVIRKLYQETKSGKPGFKDTRIREICVEVGGSALGPIFDKAVSTPGPMPWDEVVSKAGFSFFNKEVGYSNNPTKEAAEIGKAWPNAVGKE